MMSRLSLATLADTDAAARRLSDEGMSAGEAASKRDRFAGAAAALIRAGHSPDATAVAAFVPGRIEVFGKHTDYCGGRSLLCTVERGMCFVGVPRAGDGVRFIALDPNEQADLSADAKPVSHAHWSTYPGSVVRRLSRNFAGTRIGGDIAMSSDLPKASGLSSSSAMIVGTFLILARMSGIDDTETYRRHLPDRRALAGYLGTVENGQTFGPFVGDTGVGTFGGSQDHTAILCCRPQRLSMFSFCPVRHERDVDVGDGVQFVIADSGVVAEKTGDARAKYNRVSARAREVVALWKSAGGNADYLNDIVADEDALARLRELVGKLAPEQADDLRLRLDQFVVESTRLIPQAAAAFEGRDWTRLRQVADESHARAASSLFNQVPETNRLQRDLLEHGALAASAFGAGFGGSVWGLYDQNTIGLWRDSGPAQRHSWFATRPGCPAVIL